MINKQILQREFAIWKITIAEKFIKSKLVWYDEKNDEISDLEWEAICDLQKAIIKLQKANKIKE